MSIKVKAQKEKFEIADGEAHLVFRRPSRTKMLLFTLAHSKNGVMDVEQPMDKMKLVYDAMELFIKDWDGFEDEETGHKVAYTPELIDLIPGEDIDKFIEEIVQPEMEKCLSDTKEIAKAKIEDGDTLAGN